MMEKQYHVLNGDSLKEMFPDIIEGEIIVMRECLIDGEVQGQTREAFFETRATFLSMNYGGSKQDYYQKSVKEFDKINLIQKDSKIHLWFEDDLFCQVNLWFVAHLLVENNRMDHVYLIRPETHDQYGFGGLSKTELNEAYTKRTELKHLAAIAELWTLYQNNESERMLEVAIKLEARYPFLIRAVKAHIDRLPNGNLEGRPLRSLRAIMKELNTKDFAPIFREFTKRESIYGFGDLQVKRLLNQIKNS